MTVSQIVSRCRHCGSNRRQHKPNGACKTRLADTKFCAWTMEAYANAVDHGRQKALGDALTKQIQFGRAPEAFVSGPLFDNQMKLDV